MDVTASIITITTSTCSLAVQVKRLIQNVKQQDEKAKELEYKLDTLTKILDHARKVYGPDEVHSYSPREEEIQQAVKKVVVHSYKDLEWFNTKSKKHLKHGNWVSVAWKQQVAAPALARLEKSISERQQQLSTLMLLLQGCETHQIYKMLLELTNGTPPTDADTILPQVTPPIGEDESENQEDPESNVNGEFLLQAIQEGDNGTFKSLLLDDDTSLKEKDSKDRNPLLLAAHLGKVGMVKLLLNDDANIENKAYARFYVARDKSTDLTSTSSPKNNSHEKDTKTTNHREIDLNARDTLGRTALHYCAEFDMCEEARVLLRHGVDVNTRDSGEFPPAYFAAKNRKYSAMELLLERGATTDFEWPTTSFEIENLLKKPRTND
ncbi:MAG: hypothetical protein Q9201_007761 [Fulgogasparrea decipioides]